LAALAALTVAASAGPASAQVYHRDYDNWGWGPGVSIGVGFGGPRVGVSFGSGYYDDGYASPYYYRSSYAPRYRYSSYADAPGYRYSSYAYEPEYGDSDYGYAGDYYDGGDATVGFGWSDNGARYRRSRTAYPTHYRTSSTRSFASYSPNNRAQANIRTRDSLRMSNRMTMRTGNSPNANLRRNVGVNGTVGLDRRNSH